MTQVGRRFATAIAEKDRLAMRAVLASDVDFKGLTPGRLWEASSNPEVDEIVFGNWFTDADVIDDLTMVEEGEDVGDTHRIGYRFALTNADGPHVVEQQTYYREVAGKIAYLRVVCSGYRPRP